jgi:hypothetical protein
VLLVRGVTSPLALSKETVRLAPVRGRVAGGEATGDVSVHLKGGFRYVADVAVEGAAVKTLLAEAKSAGGLSGTLAVKARFEGSGGLPTLKGRGQGTVTACRVDDGRALVWPDLRCPAGETRLRVPFEFRSRAAAFRPVRPRGERCDGRAA